MGDNYCLEMKNINKSFPGVSALKNINFNLYKGEIHAILGENGAGKSTLIKILNGDYQKDNGEIFIDGKLVEINNINEARKLGISAIYQELNIVPCLSVAENIFLGSIGKGFLKIMKKDDLFKKARKVLETIGANINPQIKCSELTTAEKQIVEITRSLHTESHILIMDEPTAALTEQEAEKLFSIMKASTKKGTSIIYISHRIDEVLKIANRITVLRDGMKINTVDSKSIEHSELIRMMVGRDLVEMYPKRFVPKGNLLLKVKNLSIEKSLYNISFELFEGEILGIFGLMGAGRNVLANALFGVVPIDLGKIYIGGKEALIKSPGKAINSGIGLVPADRRNEGLVLSMNVAENITLANLTNYNKFGILDMHLERNSVAKWVKELKIKTPSFQQNVAHLSGGNQQKVVLAKWLDSNKKILILNEPTRGIDVGAKVEIYNLIEYLCGKKIGVIMMSSEIPEIMGISDRVLVMCAGKITGMFTKDEASPRMLMDYATRKSVEGDKEERIQA